ncbi:hypothetical protein AAY473_018070 [Plecturocebus cupreus]
MDVVVVAALRAMAGLSAKGTVLLFHAALGENLVHRKREILNPLNRAPQGQWCSLFRHSFTLSPRLECGCMIILTAATYSWAQVILPPSLPKSWDHRDRVSLVAQASLQLLGSSNPPFLASQNKGQNQLKNCQPGREIQDGRLLAAQDCSSH